MDDKSQVALALVASCAERQGFTVEQREQELLLAIPMMLNDDERVLFHIQVSSEEGILSAKEAPALPRQLPAFCPERHIVGDGSFCLNLEAVDPLKVEDPASAQRWLDTLTAYLRIQLRVRNRRKWPGSSWAHGLAAAFQWRAQQAATALSPDFVDDLAAKRLRIERQPGEGGNGTLLHLYRDGQLAYVVWGASGRVARFRQEGVGKSRRMRPQQLRSDGHAKLISLLAAALWKWKEEEACFWESYRDRECCGTMEDCPLRLINDQAALSKRPPAG